MDYFNTFESYIYYDFIDSELKKCKKGTAIIVQKYGEDKDRKTYYRGFINGKHWVNYSPENQPYQNSFVVFPSKYVEIKKIGAENVETKDDFKFRIKSLYGIKLKTIYKDAKYHSKAYPDPTKDDLEY